VFASLSGGLLRVPSTGGEPRPLTVPDTSRGEISHRWPQVLPGAEAIIFTIKTKNLISFDDALIGAVPLEGGSHRIILEGGMYGRFAPTGHLLCGRRGELLAAPFEPSHLLLRGAPVPVLKGLMTNPVTGNAHYAFSLDGTLVYDPSGPPVQNTSMVWVDREGRSTRVTEERRHYFMPQISPDGRRAVLWIPEANDKLWVCELDRGTLTRLTFGAGNDFRPIWTPDGSRITFGSDPGLVENIFWIPADGSGPAEVIVEGPSPKTATSWSPDGRTLVFHQIHPETGSDIWMLRLGEGGRTVEPFLRSPFNESGGAFSPDGRWLAYQSEETGRSEVYIQSVAGRGKLRVSSNGGEWPVWSKDGREVFYMSGEDLVAVSLERREPLRTGRSRVLFSGTYGRGFDVAQDGRFLMILAEKAEAPPSRLNIVLNWFDELKRQVPAGR
jgi:serine/threonine-protein kinase